MSWLRFCFSCRAFRQVEHQSLDGLPDVDVPTDGARERAREHGMPPSTVVTSLLTLHFVQRSRCLLQLATAIDMPDEARSALVRVTEADSAQRLGMARAVLESAIPFEQFAEHLFVASALQVHCSRLASRLDAKKLVPVGDGVCPCCGGGPVASMVVGWTGAQHSRFCVCSLCATQWNYVRIKCTLCASTKGISYREIEGGDGTVWAETCDACRGYVKILHQHGIPDLTRSQTTSPASAWICWFGEMIIDEAASIVPTRILR